jgi:hypothetical protein
MSATKRKRAPGGGRKPAGDHGEKTSEYPVQQLRFPISTLAPMRALATVRGVPLWRLFDQAAWMLLKQLRGSEAEEVIRLGKQEATRLRAKAGK